MLQNRRTVERKIGSMLENRCFSYGNRIFSYPNLGFSDFDEKTIKIDRFCNQKCSFFARLKNLKNRDLAAAENSLVFDNESF